ncbi:MAG: Do family serine endopeptidase [Gammaproteobacteria bacterium]|nr:Do family serine endopeptidase [Gammaproteobacteria bacterium]
MSRVSRNVLRIMLSFLGGLWIATTCLAGTATSTTLAPMLKTILPTVVNIRAQLKITDINTLNRLQKNQQALGNNGPIPNDILSIGSGVILDATQGYILTNAHVVEDAERIVVTLGDGRHYTAKTIGLDRPSDIALLQIRAKNLQAIHVANSSSLKVGDFVAAIGNPFGLNQTVTSGIVSALGRNTLGIETYENFIQIDAPINPGNSGGALVNTNGELIGINTAILAPNQGNVGIGFAIPSNQAMSVMRQLLAYGNVKRGTLGVGVQDITPDLASAFGLDASTGAVVTLVMPNSPGAKAGLQAGDILMSVNGTSIGNANDLVNAISSVRVDSRADMVVLRKGKKFNISVKLTDPKERQEENAKSDPYFNGVALKNFHLTSPIHGKIEGILVVSVDTDTNAWHADLRVGDVITSANQQKVTSVDDLKKIADGTKDNLLLNVLRENGAVFLVITKES